MDDAYTLWGSPHSLYTGKVRSYLLKKGLPFRERLPRDPRYREAALPAVRLSVAPIVETPDGQFLQDSTEIIDELERRVPEPRIVPATPVMRFISEVLDAFGCEFLLAAAMHYRWSFRAEQEAFLEAEFGRLLHAGPDRAGRREAGRTRMGYFHGFLPALGVEPSTIPAIETAYLEFLDALDAHLQAWPYVLGGRPSIADFGLMAPLFAHLGRDPYPAQIMKLRAPNVFRWTERMNLPGTHDGEFEDTPEAYFADEAVPETLRALLSVVFADIGPELAAHAEVYNAWASARVDAPRGTPVANDERRRVHPKLGPTAYAWRGCLIHKPCAPQTLWHFDRATQLARSAGGEDARRLARLVRETGGAAALDVSLIRPLIRSDYLLALG